MPRGRHRVFQDEQEALLGSEQPDNWLQLRNRGHQQQQQQQQHQQQAVPTVGFVQHHGGGGGGDGSSRRKNSSSVGGGNSSSFHHHSNNNNNNPFASTLARYDFVSHEVQPGDTLAGIALRYNCKLPLLKQANNLSSEAHVAALPYVKVPVPRNGVQTGQLIDISAKVEIQREGPPREDLCPQRFMENLDEKLKELQRQAPPPPSGTPPPMTTRPEKPRTYFNSTCLIVTCLIGVCIGLPVLYTVYILTNSLHGDVFKLIPS